MKRNANRKKNRNFITLTVFLSTFLFLTGLQEAHAAPIQGVNRDQRFVDGQTSSYYNDGRYTGLLNAEYYEAEPQRSKYATASVTGVSVHSRMCELSSDGKSSSWGRVSHYSYMVEEYVE